MFRLENALLCVVDNTPFEGQSCFYPSVEQNLVNQPNRNSAKVITLSVTHGLPHSGKIAVTFWHLGN